MSSLIDSASNTMIERRIEELKDVPARDPLRAASGRARFLREAAEYRQAISPVRHARQSRWTFFNRKEKLAMTAFVSLILAFVLLLSGGATVAAAQDDLPNQPLYQLKLWTEDATLAMRGDPQEQAELLMTMAQTRVEEMAALVEMGLTPPERVRERLEIHLRETLVLAAGMDDADLKGTLLQLRGRLQTQDRILQKLQVHAGASTEPQLTRTRQMLQANLQLVDQGLADPQGFRTMMRNRKQYGPDEEATPTPNRQGESGAHHNAPTAQPSGAPGAGNENGNCEGNGSPCGPNPEKPGNGNGDHDPDQNKPDEHHPDHPQDNGDPHGNGSGGDHNDGGGGGKK